MRCLLVEFRAQGGLVLPELVSPISVADGLRLWAADRASHHAVLSGTTLLIMRTDGLDVARALDVLMSSRLPATDP